MRIIRDFEHCPDACKGAVVALGNFDGIHLGHQAILSACVAQAKAVGAPAAVMTFEPHPREFFSKEKLTMRIMRLGQKLSVLEKMGFDAVFLARFNAKLAATTAEQFVHEILHRELRVKHVVTGYDFAFGKNRQGNTEFLDTKARERGIGFTCVAPVKDRHGAAVSSTAIRKALTEGDLPQAAALLGRPYSIVGRVQGGDKRGRELGFPTANLWLGMLFRPRFGIYAAQVTFKDGRRHEAVANLGIRPMFKSERPLLEVHCFDLNRTFYGERIDVELVKFIREEARFDTTETLRVQMAEDCNTARRILSGKEAAHG